MVRRMERNTNVLDVYYLLAAGVHLSEIARFTAQASVPVVQDAPVDTEADTIPAPAPSSVRRAQECLATEPSPSRTARVA